MDAINNLVGGMHRAQVTFDGAARQLAAADLPTTSNPDPANPVSPRPSANNVDVADQLVTMAVAADMHHVTAAALRSAFNMYRESLDLVTPALRD